MSENKRPDTQGWDTEAVRRRIISEVDAGTETGSKKKKHRKFNWKIYIAAVVLGSMLLAGLGWILANDLCALDKGNDTYTVTIEEGDGVFKIASKLKKAGLIELKGFFVLYEIFTGAKKDIDPGTYELNTSMDYRSLVNNMYDPDARRRAQEGLVLLTIPEGSSTPYPTLTSARSTPLSTVVSTDKSTAWRATFSRIPTSFPRRNQRCTP